MPVIDFHNHYYPPKYLEALRSGGTSVKVTIDAEGNPVLHYPGDYNIAVRGHRDLTYRTSVLDEHRVDMQVVSLTTPGTHVESPKRAVELASLVNDEFRAAMDTNGQHFTALATLPLNDPAASAAELQRACTQLGMRGAMLFSNVNGRALSDEIFWSLYEVANDLDAVLYIHPTAPVGVEAMQQYLTQSFSGTGTYLIAYGVLFLAVILLLPRGVVPTLTEMLRNRRTRTPAAPEPASEAPVRSGVAGVAR